MPLTPNPNVPINSKCKEEHGCGTVARILVAGADMDWGLVVAVADLGVSEGSLALAIRSKAEAARNRGSIVSLFG